MTPRAAAIYVRISSDPQDKRDGIRRQEKLCRDKAAELGWTIGKVYTDNDTSAMGRAPRPAFEQLLADAAAGRIDGILCWHSDRLYRRTADLARIVDALGSVPLETVTSGGVDLVSSHGRMQARIMGAVAEHEVEHAVERMKAAHLAAAESGQWRVHGQVFGYRRGGTEVESAEAQALRDAATDILSGVSTGEIARRWNRNRLQTKGSRDEWTSRSVVKTITNPLYACRVRHNGVVLTGIEGQWPRILEDSVFDALAAMLAPKPDTTGRSRDRRWQGSGVYRCGTCEDGPRMQIGYRRARTTNEPTPYYRCQRINHSGCNQAALDGYVDEVIVGRLSRSDAAGLVDAGAGVDVPGLTARRDGLIARINRANSDWSANPEAEYSDLLAALRPLRSQVAEIDAQLQAQAQRDPVAELVLAEGDSRTMWEALDPQRRSKIIDILMTVTVLPAGRGARFSDKRVRIEWKR